MATVEDFVLRFKTVGAESIKQTGNAISGLKNDVNNLAQVGGPFGNTINGIITKLGPLGLAAGLAGGAIAGLGFKALQTAGEMQDIAGSTGIATGVINSFADSLIFAGGKSADASNLLNRLNQSVQEAASGNETLQKSFRDLGIFITQSNGEVRSTEEILKDLVQRFKEGELSAAQYTAAIAILGKTARALELQNLSAVDDPAFTEATANIDKLNDAIDQLTTSINTQLVVSFGDFAIAVNQGGIGGGLAKITEELGYLTARILNLPTDIVAGFFNLFGANIKAVGFGTPIGNLADRAREERLRLQKEFEKAEELKRKAANEGRGPAGTTPLGPAGGGFGAASESSIKAAKAAAAKAAKEIADATVAFNKRIELSNSDVRRQTQLKSNAERLSLVLASSNEQKTIEEKSIADIAAININTSAEIEKAKTNIFAQERLTRLQKENEFTLKETELKLKAETDIARLKQSTTEQLTREQERIENIIQTSKARVEEEQAVNELLTRRNQFINNNVTATSLEQIQAQKIFDIEEERLDVLRRIRQIQDLPQPLRAQREKEINDIYDDRLRQTRAQNLQDVKNSRDFQTGMVRAFKEYAENARNASKRAENLFRTATSGMEEAIVGFARTGKFEFSNFMDMMLEELLRSQVQQLFANMLGGMQNSMRVASSSSGGGGNIFDSLISGIGNIFGSSGQTPPFVPSTKSSSSGSFFGSVGNIVSDVVSGIGDFFGGFFANGGSLAAGKFGVVGERGPEFISGPATITPMGMGGVTNVTYNIVANDAASFREMVARDPSFIYAVSQQGAKSIPGRR